MTKIESGGDTGDRIEGYKLPIIDTQTEKRNFPGYDKKQWYSLEELRSGDIGGTTDTDTETDVKAPAVEPYNKRSGYSQINRKSGSKPRPTKTSSPRTKTN